MSLSTEAAQNVRSILDHAVADKQKGIPGLVFAAKDKSGNTLIEHATGTRGVNSNEPVDLDTTFWMASMTKIVTTIACMQLYEQGKFPLDDQDFVKKWAPEIGEKKVYLDGVTPHDQEKQVTVRMLLAHTAGFGYSFLDPRVNMGDRRPIGIDELQGDLKDLYDSPMVNQPGSMWEYGVSIDWVGVILERSTGLGLNEYFQKHIFQPLGVRDVDMFPNAGMRKNLAYMHQRGIDGTLYERDHCFRRSFRAETAEEQKVFWNSGGAGLFGKPTEYLKVLTALANDGTCPTTGAKMLSKETVDHMWENQIPEHPNFARNGPPPANPFLANHAPEMYPQGGNPPQGWGLSFFLTIQPGESGRGANTAFWAGLANCYWWVDRERGVAGVIAAQVLPFGDGIVVPAWWAAEKGVYDGLGKQDVVQGIKELKL